GVTGSCAFDVVVTAVSQLDVSIQLSPTLAVSPLTRCITFELFQCGFAQETVKQEITFVDGVAIGVPVLVPAGFYECITARDELHSLRSTATDFSDDGTTFSATFVGDRDAGGHWLTGGNLNDNDFIDIVDFGIFHSLIGTTIAVTDCATPPFHADINGDGLVNSFDFTFISQNFFDTAEANCCAVPPNPIVDPNEDRVPRRSITLRELTARGLGHLRVADLNNDGVLDERDMNIAARQYKAGTTPEPAPRPAPHAPRRQTTGPRAP
ncbi:MAG: hypothetical protein ACE5E6_08780, partial [Phycisphaerae bacterium]